MPKFRRDTHIMKNATCTNCGNTSDENGWILVRYSVHEFNGYWCSDCYSKVALDGFDNPKNPEELVLVLLNRKDIL